MSLATCFIIACCAVSVQSARTISEVEKVDAKVDMTEFKPWSEAELAKHLDKIKVAAMGPPEFVCGHIRYKEAACYPKARKWGVTSSKTAACTSQCTVEDKKTGTFANEANAIQNSGVPKEKLDSSDVRAIVLQNLAGDAKVPFNIKTLRSMKKQQHCTCPNAGESCQSVNGENPGLLAERPTILEFEGNKYEGRWTGPVKVEVATGKWVYLTATDKWKERAVEVLEAKLEAKRWNDDPVIRETPLSFPVMNDSFMELNWVFPDQVANSTGNSFMDLRNVLVPHGSHRAYAAAMCDVGALAEYYILKMD